jgi:hypothetical protein
MSEMRRCIGTILTFLAAFGVRAEEHPATPLASVPITLSRGLVMVPAKVNDSGPHSFLLDTGYTLTMVRRGIVEKLGLAQVGSVTVQGIAGESREPTFSGAVIDVGGAVYNPRRVGGMPDTRRRRDGIIGSGLFRQYVVMVDPVARKLELFSRTNFQYRGPAQATPLRFRRSTPIIEATIARTNGEPVTALFEIDTGCDSGVCLGSEFTRTHKLLESTATRSGTKVGAGGDAATQSGHLYALKVGSITVEKPQTDFFTDGSPADDGLAGHVGMGVLGQFRVYFDYGNQRMFLEKLEKSGNAKPGASR